MNGNIVINGNAHINAVIYATGNVTISGQVEVVGGIGAAGTITLNGTTAKANPLDPSQIEDTDFGDYCIPGSPPPNGQLIHHYELEYSDSPLTCQAEPITVKACANEACDQLITGNVTATMVKTPLGKGGWSPSANLSFADGVTTVDLRHNDETPINISVSGSIPSNTNPTLCSIAGGTPSEANCTLSFARSGFIMEIPNTPANKLVENVLLKAVKEGEPGRACVPLFSGTKESINFQSSHLTALPDGIISHADVSVNDKPINQSGEAPTPIEVSFDANGEAFIKVHYADAGKVAVKAEYAGRDGTEQEGLVISKTSTFVSYPAGFCVDASAQCEAGDASCPVFKKAGETFELSIKAMAWDSGAGTNLCDNPVTPSYEHAGIDLSPVLRAPSGGVLADLGVVRYDHKSDANAETKVNQSVSEVGVFEITAKAPATYLGANVDIQGTSKPIGRFVPAQFSVSGTSVMPACVAGDFSYMDEPFTLNMTVDAQNVAGGRTLNYFGDFAKGSGNWVAVNNRDGDSLSSRMSAQTPLTWATGRAQVTQKPQFSRPAAPLADGPYEQLEVGTQIVDNDGNHATLASPDMADSVVGDCATSTPNECDAKRLGMTHLRQGRLVLTNTYGPEDVELRMPVVAEYWVDNRWQTNTLDGCSLITRPNLGKSSSDSATGYRYAPELATDESVTRGNSGGAILSGQSELIWTGAGGYRGQVTAPLELSDTPWLRWYWNWNDSSAPTLQNPRASAYFGTYRGNDRVIFWREVN
ncbi:DUF6701 domain-containing protein [Paraferrimonas sedimenticola]|uniref:DUF6701 domain-containing protein n=1 Tax=Paraferrimonas sedimenticola TaxID=375674 RepID=UPI000BA90C34|nr:DUF6701 domain-containing protein [Paraferrimonas sedimenticola]